MKTDDEMYSSLLSRWDDYRENKNKRRKKIRVIIAPATVVLGFGFTFWVVKSVNGIVKPDNNLFTGSSYFNDSDESESENDLLLITEEDGIAHGYFNYNVVNDGIYKYGYKVVNEGIYKYGRFKASKSSGTISFSGCPTGAARICIHSDSYDGPVECCIINPDTTIPKQSISFSLTLEEYYYITIETYDDYIQTIGEFELVLA